MRRRRIEGAAWATMVAATSAIALAAHAPPVPEPKDLIGKALSDVSTPYPSFGPRGAIRCAPRIEPATAANQRKFLCVLDFLLDPDRPHLQNSTYGQVANLLVFGDKVMATDPPVEVEVIRGALALPPLPNQASLLFTRCTIGDATIENALVYYSAEAYTSTSGLELRSVAKIWAFDAAADRIREVPVAAFLVCAKPEREY